MEALSKVWNKMTEGEQLEYACRVYNGYIVYEPDGSVTIMKGLKSLQLQQEYEKQMLEKYGRKTT